MWGPRLNVRYLFCLQSILVLLLCFGPAGYALRRRREPTQIVLSAPVAERDDDDEIRHRLGKLESQQKKLLSQPISDAEEVQWNKAAVKETLRKAEAEDRHHDVEEMEDMKKEAAEEGKVEGEESATMKLMADTGTHANAVQHAQHEILKHDANKQEEEIQRIEDEASEEETAIRERDKEEEKKDVQSQPKVVTDEDLQLEDSATNAFDEAEDEIQKAEAVTSNVLDEERKSAISSMKQQDISEEEDEKNKAEVKPTTMNQSSANQPSPTVTGAMEHPCPCIEEMMEQPCPPKKTPTVASAEGAGCAEILAKAAAEEKLHNAEESVKKVVKHPEGLKGGPFVVKKFAEKQTAESEGEEENEE